MKKTHASILWDKAEMRRTLARLRQHRNLQGHCETGLNGPIQESPGRKLRVGRNNERVPKERNCGTHLPECPDSRRIRDQRVPIGDSGSSHSRAFLFRRYRGESMVPLIPGLKNENEWDTRWVDCASVLIRLVLPSAYGIDGAIGEY